MDERVENSTKRDSKHLFRCQRCKNHEFLSEGETHYCKICGQKMIPYPKYPRPDESKD